MKNGNTWTCWRFLLVLHRLAAERSLLVGTAKIPVRCSVVWAKPNYVVQGRNANYAGIHCSSHRLSRDSGCRCHNSSVRYTQQGAHSGCQTSMQLTLRYFKLPTSKGT